ncbi:single-stranded DNA-binding protein [Acaricomes phytoseiuli]|uniref:single-stranded DNA-binding protein n=1 Tax=Acaricomes phytoseiuli TaxID=291968 RepID=UPI002223D68E|nr:single-stranded DNA-binding protein [Acaricomes phytoseiuli]MCW1249968.1 single-stranded DNA-binding protein [Acaricomes phytoseiuli]
MSDVVTIRGFVASEVRMTLSDAGCPIAHFRIGSTERKFDRHRKEWVDAETNWYAVSVFRALAQNVTASLSKGERVIVTGKLKLRQWSKEDGRRGIAPEIDADAIGHDLNWGTARFRRALHPVWAQRQQDKQLSDDAAEETGAAEDGLELLETSETSETSDAASSTEETAEDTPAF